MTKATEYVQKKNAKGRLHCEDGPAMFNNEYERWYIDGTLHREDGPAVVDIFHPEDSLYLLNGVGLNVAGPVIAKKIVENPQAITVDEIKKISNEEVRRIAIERKGTERFLKESNAVVIDSERNDIDGTEECLFNCDIAMYFCGICISTGRVYYLEIPKTITTCKEAKEFLSSGKKANLCVGAS